MILQILALRDSAADVYGVPTFHASVGAAVRSFSDACNGDAKTLSKHPEHFELFHIGTYDDSQAIFTLFARPVSVALASNLVRG